jgi:hypothetical protein
MVNYTGGPFDGPSVGGLVVDIRKSGTAPGIKHENLYQVFWGTHNMTAWTMEKDIEVAA